MMIIIMPKSFWKPEGMLASLRHQRTSSDGRRMNQRLWEKESQNSLQFKRWEDRKSRVVVKRQDKLQGKCMSMDQRGWQRKTGEASMRFKMKDTVYSLHSTADFFRCFLFSHFSYGLMTWKMKLKPVVERSSFISLWSVLFLCESVLPFLSWPSLFIHIERDVDWFFVHHLLIRLTH